MIKFPPIHVIFSVIAIFLIFCIPLSSSKSFSFQLNFSDKRCAKSEAVITEFFKFYNKINLDKNYTSCQFNEIKGPIHCNVGQVQKLYSEFREKFVDDFTCEVGTQRGIDVQRYFYKDLKELYSYAGKFKAIGKNESCESCSVRYNKENKYYCKIRKDSYISFGDNKSIKAYTEYNNKIYFEKNSLDLFAYIVSLKETGNSRMYCKPLLSKTAPKNGSSFK